MANSNSTSWAVPRECSEQSLIQVPNSNVNMVQASTSHPNRVSNQGPVAILWDIENCPVPSDVRPEDVAGNIRMALRVHPVIKGAVTHFSAYGDFNAFPRRVREGCQRTGVNLIDVPNVRKDASDKAILVDMLLFALDNRPPSSIMLISGDVDFSPALHIIGQRGYTVILVIPSNVGVSSALCKAGRFVWDWPSVARGEGFVPPTKPCPHDRGVPAGISGVFMSDNPCHPDYLGEIMANSNSTSWAGPKECSEQSLIQVPNSNVNMVQPSTSPPNRVSNQGHVSILWDIENCPVPSDVRPEDVAGNVRMALRVHPVIKGAVTLFSAYGDFNAFPRWMREGCQRTGVKLIDVPNGRKDAADKAILVDMFLFALDNPPPSSIMLISGDVDFAPALHILGQRGYTVILVIPCNVGVSSALCNAGRFVWDWPSVARGEGFVPPTKPCDRGALADISGIFMGCHISDNADGNEEEAIVYRGLSQSYYNAREFSMVSQSLAEYSSCMSSALPSCTNTFRSQSLPTGANEATSGSVDHNDVNWVQPGDVNGLKGQLVKLLGLSGGCLPLVRVPAEYQKVFGRPLYIPEYGAFKLVNLLKKMSDAISIEGKGKKKLVYLRNVRGGPGGAPPLPSRKDKRAKGVHDDNTDANAICGSSDEFSDEERSVVEEPEESRAIEKPNSSTGGLFETKDQNLLQFKYELEEILVSYSCRIPLSCFEDIYRQRYKKALDYRRFGVIELEELLGKVTDVVQEEPVTKKKFLDVIR